MITKDPSRVVYTLKSTSRSLVQFEGNKREYTRDLDLRWDRVLETTSRPYLVFEGIRLWGKGGTVGGGWSWGRIPTVASRGEYRRDEGVKS